MGMDAIGGLVMVAIFAFLLLGLVALAKGARTVKQYEKGLITRLGKYHGMAPSGLTFIVPFVDDIMRVDMREQVITVPPQKLITKDNVTVEVDAVVYYKVIDPVKSQYEVQDFGYACTTLAQTNLRNLIGDRTLDETLVARDMINTNLREVLDEATNNWGVKVTRVEVQKIEPPRDITDAMSRQMKAEREKRAAILEAEGIKQSQILQAEGKKQSEILKAEGDASRSHQARLHRRRNLLQGARRDDAPPRSPQQHAGAEHEIYRAFQLQPRKCPGHRRSGARFAQIRSGCVCAARFRPRGPLVVAANACPERTRRSFSLFAISQGFASLRYLYSRFILFSPNSAVCAKIGLPAIPQGAGTA